MDQTNHTPPFATPPPPPPPIAVLLQATDLPIHSYPPLLSAQDLPIKGPHFAGNTPTHSCPPPEFAPAPQNAWPAPSVSDEPTVHIYPPWRTTPRPKRFPSAAIDDPPSPLSSFPSCSPSPTPPPRRSPRHSLSAAGPSQLPQTMKVRIRRPKGAGRNKIADMIDWSSSLLKAIQVCFVFAANFSNVVLLERGTNAYSERLGP
jgi:hypothetical protein